MTEDLEKLIDRRWEEAKKLSPNITRDDVSRLVYRLAAAFGELIKIKEFKESKNK